MFADLYFIRDLKHVKEISGRLLRTFRWSRRFARLVDLGQHLYCAVAQAEDPDVLRGEQCFFAFADNGA